jgi:hypothetical protein
MHYRNRVLSANTLMSVALVKKDSVNYTSAMATLSSTLYWALVKVFVKCQLELDKEKSS